MPNRPLS